jgi:hypothetical protein
MIIPVPDEEAEQIETSTVDDAVRTQLAFRCAITKGVSERWRGLLEVQTTDI